MDRQRNYKLLLDDVITKALVVNHLKDGKDVIIYKAKQLLTSRQRYQAMPERGRDKLLSARVDGLIQDCVRDYKSLLAEVITRDMVVRCHRQGLDVISQASRLLGARQRYIAMPPVQRDKLLREHVARLKQANQAEAKSIMARR